jgi:hypothetical protein
LVCEIFEVQTSKDKLIDAALLKRRRAGGIPGSKQGQCRRQAAIPKFLKTAVSGTPLQILVQAFIYVRARSATSV